MPRKSRLSVPGAVTHVMARCLDGLYLVKDDEDGKFFVDTLSRYLVENGCRCYAWALMSNHYHVVLRLGEKELWQVFKPLNMRLAQFHSRKYARRGPLFMDRYKSIVTQDQNYIEELIRYVHLNPLRAGICKSVRGLHNYRWSGHRELIGLDPKRLMDVQTVRNRFGRGLSAARGAYLAFLEAGAGNLNVNEIVDLVRSSNSGVEKGRSACHWVIGDPEFVRQTVSNSSAHKLHLSRFQKEGADFSPIVQSVCKAFEISEELLLRRHRGGVGSDARKCFCYVAVTQYGATGKAVSEYLGIHPTAVSAMLRKGKSLAEARDLLSV